MALLAMEGGQPIRHELLPYGHHWISDEDVASVVSSLRSNWLTTGPCVAELEQAFADVAGTREAVAVSSGTAALHCVMAALGVGPGDEVIVPALTFVATANAIVFQGAQPVFADVESDTLLIDPAAAEALVTPRTRAIIAVDYAGQPCDYGRLRQIASHHGLALIADACHSLGGHEHGRVVGGLADLSTFSLHPVKAIAAGEGGMVSCDDPALAARMRRFRNHGIDSDLRQREQRGSWYYEMMELGYNYRLSDIQCALALSQLQRLGVFVARRQALATRYDRDLDALPGLQPLARRPGCGHAYHLYVVQLVLERLRADRGTILQALRAEGIGVNVHYLPVYLHPFYRKHFGTEPGLCPVAEAAYERLLTLPLFPAMSDADAADVCMACAKVLGAFEVSVG